jgi:ubiquinone/menaquinone biosynthesis C-methylase UbiE
MASTSHSAFSSNYERMAGNCTSLIAAQMVSTISPPLTSSSYILDNACGPGIVSEQVKHLHPNAKIMATDLSPAMIEKVQLRIKSKGWSNMQTDTLDIRSLSRLPGNTFTHVFTNLGFPVPGDPDSGLGAAREMFRVLQPGGVAIISTWAGRFLISCVLWSIAHKHP